MIDRILKELPETWAWTPETVKDVKREMANYALASMMDSAIRREVEEICLMEADMDEFSPTGYRHQYD